MQSNNKLLVCVGTHPLNPLCLPPNWLKASEDMDEKVFASPLNSHVNKVKPLMKTAFRIYFSICVTLGCDWSDK